jgi:hydroxymethylpyrimidine kinase/phosphomethylpyrimidine kinase
MVSTSGFQLLPKEAVRELREHLIPRATVLTPNIPEAMLLLSDAGLPVEAPRNVKDLILIAKAVQSLGPKFVLLKGGHLALNKNGDVAETAAERVLMVDILYGNGITTQIETNYQTSKNTHGTGCSLACESAEPSRWERNLSNYFSRHRIESRKWARHRPGGKACM